MVWFDNDLGTAYYRATMKLRGGILLAALLIPLVVHGQDGDDRQSAPPTLGIVDEARKVPNGEKESRVEKMLGEAADTKERADALRDEARSAKDIVQLNCVQEKRTQIIGLLKIAQQAAVKMKESLRAKVQRKVDHNYTKIVVATGRLRNLKGELEQCVGKIAVHAGDTQIEIEEQPSGDQEDPTDAPPPPLGPTVPPIASLF